MNYLANAGRLCDSCQVIFRTTPHSKHVTCSFMIYPKPQGKSMKPPSEQTLEGLYKRLITGNIRSRCGYSKGSKIFTTLF